MMCLHGIIVIVDRFEASTTRAPGGSMVNARVETVAIGDRWCSGWVMVRFLWKGSFFPE